MRCPDLGWGDGRVVCPLVSNIDVFLTPLELAGAEIRLSAHGRSLLSLLACQARDYRAQLFGQMTYHTYYGPIRCVRADAHKLIVNFSNGPGFMDPSQSWRARATPKVGTFQTYAAHHPPVELYDLRTDPLELTNLADDPAHSSVRDGLLAQLHTWMRDLDDPLLTGRVAAPIHGLALARLGAATSNVPIG